MTTLAALVPHLLRPWWLLMLLVLPLAWWLRRRGGDAASPWRRVVDPHLLPSLLAVAPASRSHGARLFAAAWMLAVFALAGPAWHRAPAMLRVPDAPLVVVLDLSSRMLAADLPPSRLARARLKIEQLIALREGGSLGLVAYAGDAFTVAPLSDDAASVRDLLRALTPDTMPIDGERADRGIGRASDLLRQGGHAHGRILLVADGADAKAAAAAREARARGYSVGTLAVGTAAGAPLLQPDGTFAEDASGAMAIVRLDAAGLADVAAAGGGTAATLTADASDLRALDVLDARALAADAAPGRDHAGALRWRDDGPFVLLALLPLAAAGFRRGWLAILLVAAFALPSQRAAAAAPGWWTGAWQRDDQRADAALRRGDAASAQALARTPAQRAAAAYRAGDFAGAARAWSALGDADANYNRGNALAQQQQFDAAIAAYRRALQQRPGMPDALANLRVVERARRAQQQQQAQQPKQEPQQQGMDRDGQSQQGHSENRENMQPSGAQKPEQAGTSPPSPQPGRRSAEEQAAEGSPSKPGAKKEPTQATQPAPDPQQQQRADATQRQAMEQALRQRKGEPPDTEARRVAESQGEQRQANEELLRRIPDDPGALLRRRFALEYARRQREGAP